MGDKNKLAAGLLAFFVGGIGIHKFYLGDKTAGILYAVFCWTGIPGILAFIDAIMLLVMTDEDFNAKYNNQEKAETVCNNTQTYQRAEVANECFVAHPQSNAQTLVEYKELLDNGTITQEEFNAIKAKILDL